MNNVLLSLSLSVSSLPVASLRVDNERSTFMVVITQDRANGYSVALDCTERCGKPTHYRETTGDTPLGLFTRDTDGLVFSLWSSGVGYRMIVWSTAPGRVEKIATLSSRGRPDVMSNANGETVIQTYEGDGATGPLKMTRWTLIRGRFVPR